MSIKKLFFRDKTQITIKFKNMKKCENIYNDFFTYLLTCYYL